MPTSNPPAAGFEAMESASTSAVDPAAILLAPDTLGSVLERLKLAQRQLGVINRMIESGGDCADIFTQMAEVSTALNRVGFAVIAAGLQQCLTESPTSERVDTSSLEKLFLSLA
jgi:DNA-binding FrmR family transcriptional regulator